VVDRRWRAGVLAASLLALSVLAPGRDATAEPDTGRGDPCQRVTLVDGRSGEAVVGAEDIAIDRVSGRIFLSAYDRWALDDGVDADAANLPQGTIYAAPLAVLARRPERLPLRPVARGADRDFHPHGIALYRSAGKAHLFAINHEYRRRDGGWTRTSALARYRITPAGLSHLATHRHPGLCRANDLAALDAQTLLVTRDHGACAGPGRWLEMLLGLDRAQVVRAVLDGGGDGDVDLATRAADLGFANGIAREPGGHRVAVAATRDSAIRIYDARALAAGEPTALRRTVRLDGGPDNLSWSPKGEVIAAVHPSLLALGMARHRWFGRRRAGSRVVAVNPDTGRTRALFRDPGGTRLNAATSAVRIDAGVVVSSVLDDALLVCRP